MNVERTFRSKISKSGARTFLIVPFDPDAEWGTRSRHSVSGTVDGKRIRGALVRFGDSWGLPAGPVWLRDNGFQVGDEVEARLQPEGPQLNTIGSDFADALSADPAAMCFFEGLTTFHRKNYLRWIDGAKQAETRARRIEQAVRDLAEAKLR